MEVALKKHLLLPFKWHLKGTTFSTNCKFNTLTNVFIINTFLFVHLFLYQQYKELYILQCVCVCLCIQAMPHNVSLMSHSFLEIPSSLASGLTCTSWLSEKYRPLKCSMFSCSAQYSVVWAPDTGSVAQNLLMMALMMRVCHSLMSRASSDLIDPETHQTRKTNCKRGRNGCKRL